MCKICTNCVLDKFSRFKVVLQMFCYNTCKVHSLIKVWFLQDVSNSSVMADELEFSSESTDCNLPAVVCSLF